MAHPFEAAQEAELSRWPGVSWVREDRSKHRALVLSFADRSRFVTYPTSPSDAYRGPLNHVRDIRHTLAAMGAQRSQEARSERERTHRPRRTVNEPVRLSAQTSTRLGLDPFAALAGFKIKPRGWARIRAYFVRPAA